MMNEAVTKRFLLYFRLMLLVWITFIVGSVLFNGVCVLLMKPAKALAVKSIQKENA